MQVNCYSGQYYLTSFVAPTPITSDFLYKFFPLVPTDDSLVPLMRLRVLVSSKNLSNVSGEHIPIQTSTSSSYYQDDSLIWLDLPPSSSINIQPYLHQALYRLHLQVVIPGYCHPYDGEINIESQIKNEYEEYQTAIKVSDQGAEELTCLTNVTLPLPLLLLALKKKKAQSSEPFDSPLLTQQHPSPNFYLINSDDSTRSYRTLKTLFENEKQAEYNEKMQAASSNDLLNQLASNEVVKQGLKSVKKGASSFWKAVTKTTEMLQQVNITETLSSTLSTISGATHSASGHNSSSGSGPSQAALSSFLFDAEKTLTQVHRLISIQYDPNRNDVPLLSSLGLRFQSFSPQASVQMAKYEGNLLSQLYFSLFSIQPKDLFAESSALNKSSDTLNSLNDFDSFHYMSENWKTAGFQSTYPPNDLKTSGLLALASLYYMSSTYPIKTRAMFSSNSMILLQRKMAANPGSMAALPNPSSLYPFALIAVNLTLMLVDVLRVNNKEFLSELASYTSTDAYLKFLIFQDMHLFYEVFSSLFFFLNYEWVSKGYIRSRFNELIQTVKQFLLQSLEVAAQDLLRQPSQDPLVCWLNAVRSCTNFAEVYNQTPHHNN